MKDKNKNGVKSYIIFGVILTILIFLYAILLLINHNIAKKYSKIILPNFYVDEYDMSNYTYDKAYGVLRGYEEKVLKRKVNLVINSIDYTFTLKDLGLKIDIDKTFDSIKNFQKKLNFSRKLWYINGNNSKKTFKLIYYLDDEVNSLFLNNLRNNTYVEPISGYFDTNNGVRYVEGIDGYSLNIEDSKKSILDYFNGDLGDKLNLIGDDVDAYSNDSYKSIDTMTSSFVTTYDTWIYARAQNLRTAINYINGAIIEPGEIFSYHKYAGPYDKAGYVFYYKFFGNGVCQVATTVYNAALLGGLEIVKRSPHDKKSEYVAGGLDATVADYGSWNVDMQWKNTYDYPIYVKAYDYNGEVHVEFWSNHDAKKGKSYSTESRWLGGRSYKSYLHVYENNQEIDVREIDYTYYIND